MSSVVTAENLQPSSSRSDTALLLALCAAVALLHILTNNRYGFHRDELQFLADARHLDWGFVAYPPFTPFMEHIGLGLFGINMVGLRLFSVIAQAIAIFISGFMARDLGGGRFAQCTAALAVAFSPLPVFEATEFQYSTFDFLWWVLVAYFTIRLLNSENPRWWLAIGTVIGLGLLTKYSITFYVAGILAGLVFTSARRFFKSPWFWAAVALALLIFLPNFLWLLNHHFISYHFLQVIHARDVRIGRANGFVKDQFLICANLVAAPLWIAGVVAFARSSRFRMIAFMAVVPVLIFGFAKGRGYYVAGVYPMLLAMGAVLAERWIRSLPRWASRSIQVSYFTLFAALSAYVCAILIPLQSAGPLRNFALAHNGDLREEIGWDELVRTVAQIRDSLPPDQQRHLVIATGNYGEYGAIDILGPAYGLPEPIGTTNSEYLRGYPLNAPTTVILLGNSAQKADQLFTNCRLAGHNANSEGVRNEESLDHPDIFVCGPPRLSWPQLWLNRQQFG